ncbi:MAG: C40 family peptidase [Jatrophihabitans sp.]
MAPGQAATAARCIPPPAALIAAAKSQTGKGYTYSWGGGGKSGPSNGICCSPSGYDDRHRYGYDCSGLTQYAFWQGAHIDIGTVTSIQWTKGKQYPWSQRKVGDLLFWGTGSSTTHVAIYIGDGKMIEAAPPPGKNSVHVTSVYGSHNTVIRVIH